ncbi:MAG: hypothetical protein WD490_00650 [Opitutales bacterium]
MKNKKKTVAALAASFVLLFSPLTLTAEDAEQTPQNTGIREILESLTPDQIETLRAALRSEDQEVRANVWRQIRAAAAEQQQATGEGATEEEDAFFNGLALRGITSIPGEGLSFSIHDPEGNRTFSLQVGQTRHGTTLKAYDASTDRITLVSNGKEREVGLSSSQIATLEVPNESAEARRERWQARQAEQRQQGQQEREQRMERMQQIRQTWAEAAQDDPELQAIQRAFQEAGSDMRRAMGAARESGANREEMQAMAAGAREEFQELSQRAMTAMQANPAFEGLELSEDDRILPFGGPGGPGALDGSDRRAPRGGGRGR